MMLRAEVEGFTFWGTLPPLGGVGCIVGPDGFGGLDDGVAVKGEVVSRTMAHGDFDLPTFMDSRIVPLSGTCLADSAEQLGHIRRQFTGLLAGRSGKVIFEHLGSTVWGIASLAPGSQKKFKVNGATSTDAEFQIQFKFSNPRLYGESRTVASGVASVNYGNFGASPILEVKAITAMPSGWSIAGPGGKLVSTTQALTVGQVHRYDTATGRLTRNGVRSRADVRADTWVIPGGGSFTHALAPVSGTGSLGTTTLDTFI